MHEQNDVAEAGRKFGKPRRIAVVAVSVAMLFGLAGAGAGAAQASVPPGPCDPEEVGQERAGLDGKLYVCEPLGSDASSGTGSPDEAGAAADVETQRLEELAADPSHDGAITTGTLQEARAALGLEETGQLPAPVRRDPTGGADFIDGQGVEWDAKAFNSNFPNGYDLTTAMRKINGALQGGENVILITENLNAQAVAELSSAVEAAGVDDRVLYWP